MEVELPLNPYSNDLFPGLLVFEDVYGFKVFEGPNVGVPAILDMTVAGSLVRIDTIAGYRELHCSGVKVEERNKSEKYL